MDKRRVLTWIGAILVEGGLLSAGVPWWALVVVGLLFLLWAEVNRPWIRYRFPGWNPKRWRLRGHEPKSFPTDPVEKQSILINCSNGASVECGDDLCLVIFGSLVNTDPIATVVKVFLTVLDKDDKEMNFGGMFHDLPSDVRAFIVPRVNYVMVKQHPHDIRIDGRDTTGEGFFAYWISDFRRFFNLGKKFITGVTLFDETDHKTAFHAISSSRVKSLGRM